MGERQPYDLFAPCAPGLEKLLLGEVRSLGGVRARVVSGGVEFEANDHVVGRALLELGLAIDLRVRLGSFPATRFEAVVRRTAELDWTRFIGAGQAVRIRASARKSRLMHSGALEDRVFRGIREAVGNLELEATPEQKGEPLDAWRVFARNEHDRLSLSMSVAGEPLHRRGYRLASGKSPLREDLARALLVLAEWNAEVPLVDPFCGSGTILIEGARLARRVPPGWGRDFHFQRACCFDSTRWEKVRARLAERMVERAPAPSLGSDRDEGVIRMARANAERAGVDGDIEFTAASLGHAPYLEAPPALSGLWISNPPFGERTGGEVLRPLYQSIGRRFMALPSGWRLGLLASSTRLAHGTGVDLKSRALLDHGGLKVCFYVDARKGEPARGSLAPAKEEETDERE